MQREYGSASTREASSVSLDPCKLVGGSLRLTYACVTLYARNLTCSQCNGQKPCNTCTKRSMTCSYSSSNSAEQTPQALAESPTKKRHIDDVISPESLVGGDSRKPLPPTAAQHGNSTGKLRPWEEKGILHGANGSSSLKVEDHEAAKLPLQVETGQRSVTFDHDGRSRQSTTSGLEEEAEVYTETRMLQDPTGRLRK